MKNVVLVGVAGLAFGCGMLPGGGPQAARAGTAYGPQQMTGNHTSTLGTPPPRVRDQHRFTVIGMPDTQNYSESYPQIFDAQSQWVVDNVEQRNIKFLSHYGDVVNHGDRDNEWQNARRSMDILDRAGVPYGVTAGNHDITPSGTSGTAYIPQKYLENFGPQRYEGASWYGGASPSGMSNFQYFYGGGREFIAMSINCDTPLEELVWAQGVLAQHRDKPVMLTTHRYLQDAEDYTGGVPIVPSGRYPSIWYGVEGTYTPTGIQSDEFYDTFVRRNKNVFMVNCGHFHEEYRQTSTNAYGLPVHEVLADYQDDPNGGDGWLRIMEFDVNNRRIDVESYSPTLDQFRTADESRFSLDVNFDAHAPRDRKFASFQNGINGYTGTQDTWINQDSGNTSYGNSGTFDVDDDTANSIITDDRGQALLRFDNIIGSGPGQIPLGATITSATLRVQLTDDVDFIYDADFNVHMMLAPWSESSTWNSLGSGVNGGEIGMFLHQMEGDNSPDGDFMRQFNVLAAVQAWANGAANWGFAFLPEIISGNDDGITVASSENPYVLYRPILEVEFTLPGGFGVLGRHVVPAPGAGVSLAALGLLACGRRRRD